MKSRTLLIVDDDADLREMLVEQLSLYEEFGVLEEATASKGIQTARSGVGVMGTGDREAGEMQSWLI